MTPLCSQATVGLHIHLGHIVCHQLEGSGWYHHCCRLQRVSYRRRPSKQMDGSLDLQAVFSVCSTALHPATSADCPFSSWRLRVATFRSWGRLGVSTLADCPGRPILAQQWGRSSDRPRHLVGDLPQASSLHWSESGRRLPDIFVLISYEIAPEKMG